MVRRAILVFTLISELTVSPLALPLFVVLPLPVYAESENHMDGLNPPPYRQPSIPVAESSFSFHLTDHLGSVTVSTDEKGNIKELSDYDPYGNIRAEEKSGSSSKEQRKYIGQEYDPQTDLSYLNARYYDGQRGQFLSQDPVFWEVGMTQDGKSALANPQLQNSYSYAGNNPIINKDPQGRFLDTVLDVGFIGYDLYQLGHAVITGGDVKGELGYFGLDLAGAVIPGVTGLGIVARTARVADKARDVARVADNAVRNTGAVGDVSRGIIKTGDTVSGLRVTKHAADGFVNRNMNPAQVASALKNGVKYIDTEKNTLLHIIGERAKGGYTVVTDRAQKVLVSVENFVRNLQPKSKPDRFIKMK